MARRSPRSDNRLRQQVAQEAAKLMRESGIRDFALAKRKAAEKLHLPHSKDLPSNKEIELALIEYQRLFLNHSQPAVLHRLRENAIQAMQLLKDFTPRLVGAVLSGSAEEHSPISLHLFAHTPEEVALFLMEQRIPYETDVRRMKFSAERYRELPLYRFVAGEHRVELTIFSHDDIRQAPLSPVDGRPMHRADEKEVRRLCMDDND